MSQETFEITCLHPRNDGKFRAEVGKDMTAELLVTELAKAGFLEPPSSPNQYMLTQTKTSTTIPASSTLVAAGVASGDTLAITARNIAAAEI